MVKVKAINFWANPNHISDINRIIIQIHGSRCWVLDLARDLCATECPFYFDDINFHYT